MDEHQAQLPITVQVLKGRIRFEAEGGGIEPAPITASRNRDDDRRDAKVEEGEGRSQPQHARRPPPINHPAADRQ